MKKFFRSKDLLKIPVNSIISTELYIYDGYAKNPDYLILNYGAFPQYMSVEISCSKYFIIKHI